MVCLRVRAKENLLLVLSDTYYSGWKVFVNGKEEKIYRANYNFRAIPLKAGEYKIKFIYDPISFKIGALISLLTLVGIVVYFIRLRRRPRPRAVDECVAPVEIIPALENSCFGGFRREADNPPKL